MNEYINIIIIFDRIFDVRNQFLKFLGKYTIVFYTQSLSIRHMNIYNYHSYRIHTK